MPLSIRVVEAMSRELCERRGRNPDKMMWGDGYIGDYPIWEMYKDEARRILAGEDAIDPTEGA